MLVAPAMAQEVRKPTSNNAEIKPEDFPAASPAYDMRRHVSIVVGLPGDRPHQIQFGALIDQWSDWLASGLGVPPDNLTVLSAAPLSNAPLKGVGEQLPADAKSVTEHLQQLAAELDEEDSLWVFFLGHANHDGQRALFHLPGPDLSATEYGKILKPLRCREQVIWLTMGSSGWFLKPLSREGRLVVAATLTDAEPNETEFPHALADVMQQNSTELDENHDEQISLMEFLSAVVTRVNQRYKDDERAPTEHAQLDDDGNGRGTEIEKLMKRDAAVEETPGTPKLDGLIATQLMLPLNVVPSSEAETQDSVVEDQESDFDDSEAIRQ